MKSSSKLKSSLLGLMLAVSPLTIQPAFSATGANPLFQNPLWWFGTPNPTPPPSALIYTFEPLATLPMFSQPYFGWYQNLNFEACVLGLSSVAGPYGTSTTSMTGCNGVAINPEPPQPTGNANVAVDGGTGGMSTTAVVTTVAVVGAVIGIAVSGGGDGTTGTTGTTGSTGAQ